MPQDTPLPLDEPAELAGEWWLPWNPNVTAYGRLIYSPDEGLELQTMSGDGALTSHDPIPLMLGLTVDGRQVTLLNCFVRNWSMNIPGGLQSRLYAEKAFVGMHADSERRLSMLDLHARVVNLSEWLGVSGLSVSTRGNRVTGVRYSHPGPMLLGRAGGAQLAATFEPTGRADPAQRATRLSLEQRAWLDIHPLKARRFDDLHTLVDRFCRLLSVATGIDSAVLELVGTAYTYREEFGTGRRVRQTSPVWVLYRRNVPTVGPQAYERMWFRYQDAANRGLVPVARWFRRWRTIGPVVNVYLSGLPTRTLHLEYRFLAYIQALEAFHYRKHPARMALQTRLDDLVTALPAPVKEVVPDGFTVLAKKTRNYFTHWNPKLEGQAAQGEQLEALTRAVKLLFEMTLMIELGFTRTEIARAALSENQRLVREIQTSFIAL